ncbi:hypothetical protein CVT25_001740, partial [Psilocybe cyanescens]
VFNATPLCDVCQTLDLLSTNNNRESTKYPLGSWDDVNRKAKANPPCPFCILLIPLLGDYGIGRSDLTIEWKKKGGFFYSTEGDNLAFLNEETASSPYGSARAVQETIDPAMIKKWIKICEVHHGEPCTPKCGVVRASEGGVGVKVLRVIDTIDQCIVEAALGDRYLALSYVWGDVVPSIRLLKSNVAELGTEGALRVLKDKLPKTVQDAIDLVRLIGERYLWVDSLCLIQDHDDDMLDGIAHMDIIYQCAVFTIIAGHGVDANAGLPGLHPESREVCQQIVEVLPGVQMTATTGVYNDMSAGTHTTRGWTLQELVLSHRAIIFTENRIYFRCRTNCMSEDTIYDNFPSAINEVLHSGTGINFLANTEPRPLVAYVSQLFRYTDRKLAKQSDTIHAITGILRFLSVHARSGTIEGLFTSSIDIYTTDEPGRREGFPSGSWAGWECIRDGYGGFCEDSEAANVWLQNQTYIVWYKRTPTSAELALVWDLDSELKYGKPDAQHIGYRANLTDPYGRRQTNPSLEGLQTKPNTSDIRREKIIRREMEKRQYHFLHFFAFTVLMQGFGNPSKSSDWEMMYPILGSEGQECGKIQFCNPKVMENSKGPHELILLSTMDKYDGFFNDSIALERPFYWVMLITSVGEEEVVTEKRGIGILFQDCMEHVLPPGKIWKEIVLA